MTTARQIQPYHLHRQSDPQTSRDAATTIVKSGRRKSIADICFEAVKNHEGLTAGEIGEATGLGHMKVWRRLSDLKRQGRIEMGAPHPWNGTQQATWWLSSRDQGRGPFQSRFA